MSKTIVSAFDSQQTATRLLASAIESGFDSRFFSLISPAEIKEPPLDSLRGILPGIHASLYWKHLRMGNSLLIAQVTEDEVARLIKLLQSTGGQHIEAFDQVKSI